MNYEQTLAMIIPSYEKLGRKWRNDFIDRNGMHGPCLHGEPLAEIRRDGWYWELYGSEGLVRMPVPGTGIDTCLSVREVGRLSQCSTYDHDNIVAVGLRNGVNGASLLVTLR